jgi:hypothetical protein
MTKIKYFCLEGRIQTAAGLTKKCTFNSLDLKEGLDHNCPVCGKKLLQQEIK